MMENQIQHKENHLENNNWMNWLLPEVMQRIFLHLTPKEAFGCETVQKPAQNDFQETHLFKWMWHHFVDMTLFRNSRVNTRNHFNMQNGINMPHVTTDSFIIDETKENLQLYLYLPTFWFITILFDPTFINTHLHRD